MPIWMAGIIMLLISFGGAGFMNLLTSPAAYFICTLIAAAALGLAMLADRVMHPGNQ